MTPAELNHWAAEFMGWNILHRNPCESHDDCQRVIEKAIEKGVKVHDLSYHVLDIAKSTLLATPEQKLRAVYEACKEMEKK